MKIVIAALALFLLGGVAHAEEAQCPVGEIYMEEQSHVEVVVDEEEYTECVFKGEWTFGLNSQCNGQWQFRHHAYHEVTHPAVTHEETVVDQEAGCYPDPEYEEPEPSPEPENGDESDKNEEEEGSVSYGGLMPCAYIDPSWCNYPVLREWVLGLYQRNDPAWQVIKLSHCLKTFRQEQCLAVWARGGR